MIIIVIIYYVRNEKLMIYIKKIPQLIGKIYNNIQSF